MLASSGNEGVAILQRYGHKLLTLQYESSEDKEHLEVPKMLQEFDLPARWTSLIQDHFAEAVHNLAQMWPDEQSLEVSYRVIEGFDHEFAHDIVEHPELHFHASNQALRQFLLDAGHSNMYPFVRIVHLPSDQIRTVSQLRADDIGQMVALDAVTTKISGVRPRLYSAVFECIACGHTIEINQPNEQELIEPLECSQIDGGCGRPKRQTRFQLQQQASHLINSQFIELQELPEQMKGGIQPERIICIVAQDLAGNQNTVTDAISKDTAIPQPPTIAPPTLGPDLTPPIIIQGIPGTHVQLLVDGKPTLAPVLIPPSGTVTVDLPTVTPTTHTITGTTTTTSGNSSTPSARALALSLRSNVARGAPISMARSR